VETRKKKAGEGAPATTSVKTPYVTLEAVRVRTSALEKALANVTPDPVSADLAAEAKLPPGLHEDQDGFITLWLPVRNLKVEHGPDGKVRVVNANSPRQAEKLAARDDDTSERGGREVQRGGTFKAIPLRSWRGLSRFKSRTMPVTDVEVVEDDV
jgi:hypothetical protein